jgi:capsular polysaccharide transport system ATP-binding protein
MIELLNVSKKYSVGSSEKVVLERVSCKFPTGVNVGILGLNGVGKSTLVRMLAAAEPPDGGIIERSGSVSFPLGLASIFHPDLSGRENIAFIARIYDLRASDVVEYVESFAEVGSQIDWPVKYYSSGMLARMAFGLCLAIDFETYLIDEVTEVGDAVFRRKAANLLKVRAQRSSLIVVSHSADTLREYCDVGAVLHKGKLTFFSSITEALVEFRMIHNSNNRKI